MRWSDIDWDGVAGHRWARSPKTEHHEGKAGRKLPLFPELRAVLLDASEAHYRLVRDSDLERAVRGQILAPFSAPSRAAGTRQKPTTKNKKLHSDGSRRVWAAQAGETNGRNRTRTCDLIHVTDAL